VVYAGLDPGDTLVVLGLGPVGQLAGRVALHRGAGRVIGVDLVPERLELAAKHGMEPLDFTDLDDVSGALIDLTGGRGPDGILDAVGMEAHGSPVGKFAHAAVGLLPDVLAKPMTDRMAVDRVAALHTAMNRYLRFEAGFTPHVREVAILTTAREMDSQFEWVAHEPEALKEGVPQNVIDVIKHRRSTAGLDETDATVIELGRQIWRDHKVTPEIFAKMKALFGPTKLVELVMLMGNYAGTAALLATMDMQLHAGKKPLLPIP